MIRDTAWANSIGTLSNEDGNANDNGSEKSHFWFALLFIVHWSLGFSFFALNFVNRKTMECFSMKLNKYWESFCCYIFVVSTTLKQVFSRCNFSDNYVQVPTLCIPTCSYCIYYCSLPSSSASPSSLLLPILWDWKQKLNRTNSKMRKKWEVMKVRERRH